MVAKYEVERVIKQIRQAEFKIDPALRDGHVSSTSKQLQKVELVFRSPCKNVAVVMNGNGNLEDLILAEGSVVKLNHQQMASTITHTIQEAEEALKHALTTVAKSQLKGTQK